MEKQNWIWCVFMFLVIGLVGFGMWLQIDSRMKADAEVEIVAEVVEPEVEEEERREICNFGLLGEERVVPAGQTIVGPVQVTGFSSHPEREGPSLGLYLDTGLEMTSNEDLKVQRFYGKDWCIWEVWMWSRPFRVFYLLRVQEERIIVYYRSIPYKIEDFAQPLHLKEGEIWDLIQIVSRDGFHFYEFQQE